VLVPAMSPKTSPFSSSAAGLAQTYGQAVVLVANSTDHDEVNDPVSAVLARPLEPNTVMLASRRDVRPPAILTANLMHSRTWVIRNFGQ